MELRTADGFTLHATLYDARSGRAAIIASAMGVKRRYYDPFAQYLAQNGISALTFDYRGIGDSRPKSLRGFEATMSDWAVHDLAAAIDFVARELRPKSLLLVGHSAGGQLVGLTPNADRIDRMVFVSAQSGYWRHWPGLFAVGMGTLWYTMPLIARVVGFFPPGLGMQALPRGVATQWARWGRHRHYLFSDAFARLTAPILAWSFADDRYAPKAAVDDLLSRYRGAAITRRHLEARGIGHFGFFRRGVAAPLWEETVQFLHA